MKTPAARLAGLLLLALLAVNLVPRAGRFSGDAMIHLALAERAAQGDWLAFNPHEVTAASTAPAWTTLEAALLALGGFRLALPAVSALSLALLALAALLARRAALRLGAAPPAAALAALLFASLPGVASNAPLGMEAPAFACLALALALGLDAPLRPARALGLGALFGLAALVRPEAVALLAAPALARRGHTPRRALPVAAFALGALAVLGPVAYAHWRLTGRWLPSSALSRVMAARRDPASLHLAGPLWIHLATPLRALAHLPVTVLAVLGARAPTTRPALRRGLASALLAGLALYTLATGAAHVARLSLWLWALAAPLAALGLSRLLARAAEGDRAAARWLAAGLAAHLAVAGAETALRWRSPSQGAGGLDRATLQRAVDTRRARTDRLLAAACSGGCCRAGVTPYVAAVEVQRRLTLDARVSVASLDGVTAPAGAGAPAVTFDARSGCPRLAPLLDHPAVVALLEDPRAQLGACVDPALARALDDDRAVDPWRWHVGLHGWVKQCPRADQPASSAAPSSASASRTVASRTAARPTSP